jgi:hypothetical protein
MALQKSIEYPSGVKAAYHRLVYMELDLENRVGRLGFLSYLSKAARDAGKTPVANAPTYFAIGGADTLWPFDAASEEASMAEAYVALKALPDFSGAKNV